MKSIQKANSSLLFTDFLLYFMLIKKFQNLEKIVYVYKGYPVTLSIAHPTLQKM